MAEAKHTPGPWSPYIAIHPNGRATIAVCIGADPDGKRPCIVDWSGFDSSDLPIPEQIGNAHLIAAAPELLEALESVLWAEDNQPDHRPDAIRHARAVLAKAGGAA